LVLFVCNFSPQEFLTDSGSILLLSPLSPHMLLEICFILLLSLNWLSNLI
jgi:hypothetical protein